jgi:hypothetical protein
MMLFMDFFNNNPILEASYGVYFFHNIRAPSWVLYIFEILIDIARRALSFVD